MNRKQTVCFIFLMVSVVFVASCQEEGGSTSINDDVAHDLLNDPDLEVDGDTSNGGNDGDLLEGEDSDEMDYRVDLGRVGDIAIHDGSDVGDGQSTGVFQYVMVLDRTPDGLAPTHAHGIDLYGIQLVRPDSTIFPAVQVEDCGFGEGDNQAASSCDVVLGDPAGRCLDPEIPDWVSLAGEGGYIIVSFGEEVTFSSGDRIEVFECGAANEIYDVLVGSTAEKETADWVESCVGVMNAVSCAVPE